MSRRAGIAAALGLAVLAALGARSALVRSYDEPSDRRMSEYAEFGEALVHGIASRGESASYRMPMATVLASRLQYHGELTPSTAGAWDWVLRLVLLFALCALLHPLGGLFAAAAGAALLYGVTDFRFYPDTGYATLVLLSAAVLAWRARAPSPAKTAALALAFGATLLYRSPLALFPPLLALYEGVTLKTPRRQLLILCVVPYLLLLPWIAMNRATLGRFVPFEHRAASVNVVSGALGLVQTVEGDMSALTGPEVDLSDGGAVLKWAAREVARHPLRYARAVPRRAAYALSERAWLALMALAALVVFRRRREFVAVGLLAAYSLGVHCLFTVEPRYFWPLWPLLAALAASLLAAPRAKDALKPASLDYRLASGAALTALAAVLVLVGVTEIAVASFAARARAGAENPETEYTHALSRAPGDGWLLLERGKARLDRGDAPGAAEDFAQAAKTQPAAELLLAGARARAGQPAAILRWVPKKGEYDARILQACAQISVGKTKDAAANLREALTEYQERNAVVRGPQGELGRGVQETLRRADTGFAALCLQHQGARPERERRELNRLLDELLPASSRVALSTAEAAARAGRRAEALSSLAEALKRGPNEDEKRRIAETYRKLGETARADAALAGLPATPSTWIGRAESAWAEGDRAQALRNLEKAVALPLGAGELRRAVSLYGAMKEYARLRGALDAYSRRHPEAAGYWLERAELELWTGDANGAREALDRARGLQFDDEERLRLASLRRRVGDTAAARELLAPLGRRAGASLELAEIEALLGRRPETLKALSAAGESRRAAALYADAGELARAKSMLSSLVAARPADAALRMDQAELSARSGASDEALAAAAKALTLKPDAAERRRAALLYLRLREPERARALLESFPADSDGLRLEQAELAYELGDKVRAREALDKAQVSSGTSWGERRRAAALYGKLGDFARAQSLLDALSVGASPDADFSLERAELAAQSGNRERALGFLAGVGTPSDPRRAAALYSRLNEHAKASALLEKGPRDEATRLELSAAYRRSGQAARALDALKELPANAPVLLERAEIYAALHKPAEARAALLKAETAPPVDEAQLRRVSHAYQALKDYDRAASVLDSLVAKRATAELLADRGLCLHLAGKSDAAIADLKRAIDLNPDFLPSYLTLGAVYESRGMKMEARSLYDRALARPRKQENEALRALIK